MVGAGGDHVGVAGLDGGGGAEEEGVAEFVNGVSQILHSISFLLAY